MALSTAKVILTDEYEIIDKNERKRHAEKPEAKKTKKRKNSKRQNGDEDSKNDASTENASDEEEKHVLKISKKKVINANDNRLLN